jgi:hypothetical protein
MPKRLLSLVAAVVVSLFPTCRVAGASLSDDWIWVRQVVETPSSYYHFLSDVSLAVDSEGLCHIAYYEALVFDSRYPFSTYTRYARQTGPASWTSERAPGNVETYWGDGGTISLALDPDDSPHLAWYNYGVAYAWLDGATWKTQQLYDRPFRMGWIFSSIAVDNSSTPHIAYSMDVANTDDSDVNVWYTRRVDDAWVEEPVYGGESVGTTLVLDSAGSPHIAFYDIVSNSLKYAVRNGNQVWSTEVITSGLVNPSGTLDMAFALGPADVPYVVFNPYVVYNQPSPSVLAVRDETGWSFTEVAVAGDLNYLSLAVGDDGTPHISGHMSRLVDQRLVYQGLVYVFRADDVWHVETIATGWYGGPPSIAVDGSGRPHVAYVRSGYSSDGSLMHAVQMLLPYHAHLPLVMRLD